MQIFLKYLNHRNTGLLALALALFGMIYGKAFLSIGTILLFAHGLIHPKCKSHLKLLWKHKEFLAIASIFVLYGLTGFWSDNTDYWLARMRMKLPFVAVPFGMLAIRNFDRSIFDKLMYGFFWLVTLTSIGSLIYSFWNFEIITENYKKGQVIPLPTHHIRFSLMVVFCICFGFYFYTKKYFLFRKNEVSIVLIATIFLVVFLHIIAVRSGLLALYSVVIYYLLRYLFLESNKMLAFVFMIVFMVGSYLAYQNIPTLKNKVDYTFFSIDSFNKNRELRDLSDSRRIGSLMAGYDLTREFPYKGVGFGDLYEKSNEWMADNYPVLEGLYLMPHNQYLFVSAGAGLIGLLWFLLASFALLFYNRNWTDPLFVALNVTIFSSYLVEHTIETQVGIAIYIFPVVMMMRTRMEKEM